LTTNCAHDRSAELTAEAPSRFANDFSEVVTDAMHRLGKLKKELARECGMRPDRFSHLRSGTRRPSQQEVLRIGQGLRLDDAVVNRLLVAAGFAPLTSRPSQTPDAETVAGRLGEPERAIALAEIERDLALVRRAWAHYVGVQAANQARDWAHASDRYQEGVGLYWELRAMAARFLGQVNLAAASAHPHLNQVAEAEARCVEGIEAVEMAGSKPFEVMLLTRLASIKRLRSDYEAAGRLYDQALAVVHEWGRDDNGTDPRLPMQRGWRAHWTARIQRMQGVLELFKGLPLRALEKLEPSLEHFKRGDHWDELAQVCYGLGWANGLRGDLEAAASWDRQGLAYAERHNLAPGREDDRSLLQGHLYLGGDYLDLNDAKSARTHLEQALKLAQHRRLSQYHEIGRVYLMLGKLEMQEGSLDGALPYLQAGLRFFSSQEEKVLLSTAHNQMGDLYLRRGGVHLQRALDHYERALVAARASRPPNSYYECAALVNMCRVRVRGGLPSAELRARQDGPPASETEWDVDTLIGEARELGRVHHYRNHRARLAVLEAEWALRQGDRAVAHRAAGDAKHIAHNFSPFLLSEVMTELRKLGLPEDLIDAPAAASDGA